MPTVSTGPPPTVDDVAKQIALDMIAAVRRLFPIPGVCTDCGWGPLADGRTLCSFCDPDPRCFVCGRDLRDGDSVAVEGLIVHAGVCADEVAA